MTNQKPPPDLQILLDASPTPLLEVDSQGRIQHANRASGVLLGVGPSELSGRILEELLPETQRSAHARHRRYFAAEPMARPMGDGRPTHVLRPDGKTVEVRVTLTPKASGVLAALEDLTVHRKLEAELGLRTQQLELAQRQLDDTARTDPVTGARNRAAFFEDLGSRVALSLRGGHPLSLVLLDVDGFQEINRALGEPAGDELLRRLTSILRYTSRRSDLVARTGADSFTVLAPETDADGGVCCANRIRAAVADAAWPHGPMTVSLGVETFLPDGRGPRDAAVDQMAAEIMEQARAALQQAKDEGPDRVVHARDLAHPAEETPP